MLVESRPWINVFMYVCMYVCMSGKFGTKGCPGDGGGGCGEGRGILSLKLLCPPHATVLWFVLGGIH